MNIDIFCEFQTKANVRETVKHFGFDVNDDYLQIREDTIC